MMWLPCSKALIKHTIYLPHAVEVDPAFSIFFEILNEASVTMQVKWSLLDYQWYSALWYIFSDANTA